MDWIVLLPPVVAIGLALWTRQVYLALFAGLWLGTTILAGGNPIAGLRGLADQTVAVFADAGNTRVVIFCLLVGGLIALVQASGGVAGFIDWAQRRGWGTTRRGAELLAWGVGMLIFVESSITSLTVGAVSRPFFDQLRLPREKLAYYCDATSAPVCMSIPLNGWGAYVLGLLLAQGVTAGAVGLLAQALLFNFFALFAIVFALVLAITGWGFGPMREAERRARATGDVIRPGSRPMIAEEVADIQPVETARREARNLFLPIGAMVAMIFAGLYVTGRAGLAEAAEAEQAGFWDLLANASGSTSVLWAVGVAIGAAMVLYAVPRGGRPVLSLPASTELVLKGSSGLVGVTVLIVFAFALGRSRARSRWGRTSSGSSARGGRRGGCRRWCSSSAASSPSPSARRGRASPSSSPSRCRWPRGSASRPRSCSGPSSPAASTATTPPPSRTPPSSPRCRRRATTSTT